MPLQNSKPWVALTYRNFQHYLFGRFFALFAYYMMAVGLGQYVFEQTRNPLHLGYIGLTLFFPKFCLSLVAGHVADRYDRRLVIAFCRVIQVVMSFILILFLMSETRNLLFLYALLLVMGIGSAFEGPASHALVPQLVSDVHFNNAVAWNSWFFQIAAISGPVAAGLLYSLSPLSVFWVIIVARFGAVFFILMMKSIPDRTIPDEDLTLKSLFAGIRYLKKQRMILGIVSLDLFAVLLGGAVALMPFFANEILRVGPTGLGILRGAPAVGAAVMALVVAFRSRMKKPGFVMLASVAVFGLFTVFFGLSKNFLFSVFCLAILGAADMISVVIRATLVQTLTPNEMRGRVSAINLVFIGASNELGEFESGLTAAWFGVVPAVIVGGIGTLAVVFWWNRLFPEIGRYREG